MSTVFKNIWNSYIGVLNATLVSVRAQIKAEIQTKLRGHDDRFRVPLNKVYKAKSYIESPEWEEASTSDAARELLRIGAIQRHITNARQKLLLYMCQARKGRQKLLKYSSRV